MIDDAYNGNPDGAHEAIDVLEQFKDRRKVYVTPGLVEMGSKTEEVHMELGQRLAEVADIVVLVNTPVAPYVKKGLEERNFVMDNLHVFETPESTYSSLQSLLKKGDVVILQNDWPDNYL